MGKIDNQTLLKIMISGLSAIWIKTVQTCSTMIIVTDWIVYPCSVRASRGVASGA